MPRSASRRCRPPTRCCAPPRNAVLPDPAAIRTVPRRWEKVVLVCGKCSRKVRGGFGPDGDRSLAKLLRKRTGKGKRAIAGVIETKCLQLCPKNAVCVVDGAAPGAWLVVAPGTSVDAIAARLDLPAARTPQP